VLSCAAAAVVVVIVVVIAVEATTGALIDWSIDRLLLFFLFLVSSSSWDGRREAFDCSLVRLCDQVDDKKLGRAQAEISRCWSWRRERLCTAADDTLKGRGGRGGSKGICYCDDDNGRVRAGARNLCRGSPLPSLFSSIDSLQLAMAVHAQCYNASFICSGYRSIVVLFFFRSHIQRLFRYAHARELRQYACLETALW
jgi:hypothetical protein